jgi:hypothetical protein
VRLMTAITGFSFLLCFAHMTLDPTQDPSPAYSEPMEAFDWDCKRRADDPLDGAGNYVDVVIERTVRGWDHLLTIGHGRLRQFVGLQATAPKLLPLFDLLPQLLTTKRIVTVLRSPTRWPCRGAASCDSPQAPG